MPATQQQAVDQIHEVFDAATSGLGIPTSYEGVVNKSLPPEDGQSPWMRLSIKNSDSAGQATLTDASMGRRYRQEGIIFVEVYGKSGDGLRQVRATSQAILDGFRGTITPGGVWFFRERMKHIEPKGSWSQMLVLIEYTFDEISTS